MFRRLSRKRIAIVAVVAMFAVVGAAVAYFTGGSNSATSSGTVGSATQWGVSIGTPTYSGGFSALYPGATNNTEYFPFTVTNNGSGHQSAQTITASLPTEGNGDAETAAGVDIAGCQASWFTPTVDAGNPALPADLAAAGTYTGKVDLTMQDSGTNQNACQGKAPAVTVTVN